MDNKTRSCSECGGVCTRAICPCGTVICLPCRLKINKDRICAICDAPFPVDRVCEGCLIMLCGSCVETYCAYCDHEITVDLFGRCLNAKCTECLALKPEGTHEFKDQCSNDKCIKCLTLRSEKEQADLECDECSAILDVVDWRFVFPAEFSNN